jgi:hypothetical protein
MGTELHRHDQAGPGGLDGVGLLLSAVCVIHCLATPLLVSLLPLAFWIKDETAFHFWLAAILIPVGLIAFVRGYQKHLHASVLTGGFAGFALLILGIFWPQEHHDHARFTVNVFFTISGSLVLVVSHWKNWRYSRCLACAEIKPRTQPPTPGDPTKSATANDSVYPNSQV